MKMENKETKLYETEIDAIKKELKKLPDGILTKKPSGYYVTINSVQKGITRDRQIVMKLARKAYLLKKLKHLEWNYSLVKKLSDRYKTEDPVDIIRGLPSFYKTLPVNYFFHPSVNDSMETIAKDNAAIAFDAQGKVTIAKDAKKNAIIGNALEEKNADENSSYEKMFHQGGLIFLTNSGIRVRSKSERTIADLLDENGVPYYYEAKIAFGGDIWRPDFTICRPYDGKIILWEHLGLMGKEEYRINVNKKLAVFYRHGFYPFENLICTYEEDLRNPARIQRIIETFLLK